MQEAKELHTGVHISNKEVAVKTKFAKRNRIMIQIILLYSSTDAAPQFLW